MATAPQLRELIAGRAVTAIERLVIDLCDVTFIGTAGLAAIEQGYLPAAERGIPCTVRVGASSQVLRLAQMFPLRFTEAMEIY